MIENESKTRSPKSQGVINGRSKKSTIRKRRKICRMLAADESNNLKTKKDFLEKYRQKLVEKKIDPIPSDQTLKKDMDDCKIDFKYGIARISTDDAIFDSLGYDINYSLRQMRLIYGSNDITLLNTYAKPMLYPKTLKGFLSPLDELIANTSTENNSCICAIYIHRKYFFFKHRHCNQIKKNSEKLSHVLAFYFR